MTSPVATAATTSAPAGRALALGRFTAALAARLPGTWTSALVDISTGAARHRLDARLWDLAHAQWAFSEFAYENAGIVSGPGQRELLVLARPAPQSDQFLVAALVPQLLGDAYAFEHLAPHGIAVAGDPARAAFAVRTRLLPRYTAALHSALAQEIAAYTPGTPEPSDNRPSPLVQGAVTQPVRVPDGLLWATNPADAALLRSAVSDLLRLADMRFDDEQTGVTDVLVGGGEYLCDLYDLHPDIAQIIEAAAAMAVLDAAGLAVRSLLDPALPERMSLIESWPAERQQALFQRASAAVDKDAVDADPASRASAALTRTTPHQPGTVRSTASPSATIPTPHVTKPGR